MSTPNLRTCWLSFFEAECVNPTNVRRSESITNLSQLSSQLSSASQLSTASSLSTYRPLSGIRQYSTVKRSPPSLQVAGIFTNSKKLSDIIMWIVEYYIHTNLYLYHNPLNIRLCLPYTAVVRSSFGMHYELQSVLKIEFLVKTDFKKFQTAKSERPRTLCHTGASLFRKRHKCVRMRRCAARKRRHGVTQPIRRTKLPTDIAQHNRKRSNLEQRSQLHQLQQRRPSLGSILQNFSDKLTSSYFRQICTKKLQKLIHLTIMDNNHGFKNILKPYVHIHNVIITNFNLTRLVFIRKFRPQRFHKIDPGSSYNSDKTFPCEFCSQPQEMGNLMRHQVHICICVNRYPT
jgi:hypothetical protein